MPAPSTYYEFLRARGDEPSKVNLEEYLLAIPTEDWGAEFKSATNAATDFLLRRPVAALGNHEGGELFVGVTDTRGLDGTGVRKDEVYRRLSQQGPRGDWYILDLAPIAFRTTEVPISEERRVLVVEVRKAVVPALVMDKERGPLWFERRGGSDHELTSYEAVEARRRFARGELLLQLYREYENAVRAIPDFPPNSGPVAQRYFQLPRFASCREDGTISTVLREEDRTLLLVAGANQQGGAAPGLLQRYLDAGVRIDVDAGRQSTGIVIYQYVGNELRVARDNFRRELGTFALHLQSLGVPTSA